MTQKTKQTKPSLTTFRPPVSAILCCTPWSEWPQVTTIYHRVWISTQLSHSRRFWCACMCTRRRLCRTQRANQTRKKARSKIPNLWIRSRPRRHRMDPKQYSVLHLRTTICHVWRWSSLHISMGNTPRTVRTLRPRRNGDLHLYSAPRAPICLAKRSTQMVLKNLGFSILFAKFSFFFCIAKAILTHALASSLSPRLSGSPKKIRIWRQPISF